MNLYVPKDVKSLKNLISGLITLNRTTNNKQQNNNKQNNNVLTIL
jgi:hypothetical protein